MDCRRAPEGGKPIRKVLQCLRWVRMGHRLQCFGVKHLNLEKVFKAEVRSITFYGHSPTSRVDVRDKGVCEAQAYP